MNGRRLRIVAVLTVVAVGMVAAAWVAAPGAFPPAGTSAKADPAESLSASAGKFASAEKTAPAKDKDAKKPKEPTPLVPAPEPELPPALEPEEPVVPEPPVTPEPPAPAPAPEPEPELPPAPEPPAPEPEPEIPPAPEPDPAIVAAGEIGPSGGIVESAEGDIRITFPEGSYDTTTTVTVKRLSAEGTTSGILRLAGVYAIEPSGELGAPVTLAIRYHLAVTHFQVARTLLNASSLMAKDVTSGEWLEGSTDTTLTAEGYVQGTVDHFSDWTVGITQPHGTSPDKTNYCSGWCHDLSLATNSAIRLAARDKTTCYICHGAASPELPAAGVTGGVNVQAALYECSGQTAPEGASMHRVRANDTDTAGLWCTSCHDPHKNPDTSPKLLRSYDAVTGKAVTSGNAFCWTCHGTTRNRRINLLTPNYWATTGGDKKSVFAQTLHAADPIPVPASRLLSDGSPYATSRNLSWGVTSAFTDGDLSTKAGYVLTPEVPGTVDTMSVTIDLGEARIIDRVWLYTATSIRTPEVIEVQVSADGSSYTTVGASGELDVRATEFTFDLPGENARWVRLLLTKRYSCQVVDGIYWDSSLEVNEIRVLGRLIEAPSLTLRTWPGASAARGECGNCHVPHGAAVGSNLRSAQRVLCTTCHATEQGGYGGEAAYAASAHGPSECAACHNPHGVVDPASSQLYPALLRQDEYETCLRCHRSSANSKSGINIEERLTKPYSALNTGVYKPGWSLRHNLAPSEQSVLGSGLKCSDCHGPHVATGTYALIDPDDPGAAFTATVPVVSLINLRPVADATIRQGGTEPQGSWGQLVLSDTSSVLMKFDLTQIPAGAQVQSAILVPNQVLVPASYGGNSLSIHRVTSSWTEEGVTWVDRGGGLGAWSTQGGEATTAYVGEVVSLHRYDVTALFRDWQSIGNEGLLIRASGLWGSSSGWYAREDPNYDGRLEIRYYPATGPERGIDYNAFCLKCHDGTWPEGVMPGNRALANVSAVWAMSKHGESQGTTPTASSNAYKQGDMLRPPYYFGMTEPLQCVDCHDPHGSNSVYHLKDSILGYEAGFAYDTRGRWYASHWCGQCHVGNAHSYADRSCFSLAASCHLHGPSARF